MDIYYIHLQPNEQANTHSNYFPVGLFVFTWNHWPPDIEGKISTAALIIFFMAAGSVLINLIRSD